jgi:hypothetical protein
VFAPRQQYQDDRGARNLHGANRLRSMNLGLFATTSSTMKLSSVCTLANTSVPRMFSTANTATKATGQKYGGSGLRRAGSDEFHQRVPRHHAIHLFQELSLSRLLGRQIQAKSELLHARIASRDGRSR